jgi:signal transduction histidine kinase
VESVDTPVDDQGPTRNLDGAWLARWAAIAVLGGAGAMLVSWFIELPGLRGAVSRTMKANTAFCLTLFAASLLVARRAATRYGIVARALAVIGACVATATLLEYVLGVDLRIDELLARDARNAASLAFPGRMSPIAAAGLLLLGSALALFPSQKPLLRSAAGILALAVALIALLTLFGYLYGTSTLYRFGPAIRISQYTAAAMLLLAGGALSLWPQGTFAEIFVRPSAGGVVIRQLFLPVMFIPTVLGLLRYVGERAGLFDASLGTALQAVVAILAFGSIAWYLAHVVDRMDAQKSHALEENQRLARTAQSALKIRDDFIGMAAHELRTPLTSLRLQMQLWQRGVSAEKGNEFSHLVQRQADRLMRLVESMLDGAALASGQLSLELRPVELAGLVRDGIQRLSPQLTASATLVEARLEPRVDVFGDAGRLRQLVDTLLANACKYGAGKPITVELTQPDGEARLVVRDQGIGIEPKDHSRIFDAFERAVPANNYPGLGLGLYLARQIAQAHGGRIEVESGAGSGSAFTVSFPAVKAPPPAT